MENLFKNCISTKQQGNIGHLLAMSYYSSLGWNVSNPITDSNDYDFLVETTNKQLLKVQAKTTRCITEAGNYMVSLCTSGGNQREYWSKGLNKEDLDLLFIVTSKGDCYSIPIEYVNGSSSLTLYSKYDQFKVMQVNLDIEPIIQEDKRPKEYFCAKCGNKVSRPNLLCRSCAAQENGKAHRKVERPDKDTLLSQLSTSNMSKIGEYYGVSDNAVRKWLKSYNLPTSIKVLRDQGLI